MEKAKIIKQPYRKEKGRTLQEKSRDIIDELTKLEPERGLLYAAADNLKEFDDIKLFMEQYLKQIHPLINDKRGYWAGFRPEEVQDKKRELEENYKSSLLSGLKDFVNSHYLDSQTERQEIWKSIFSEIEK